MGKRLKRGELLFRKGDEGSNAYIVASGKLKVITAGDDGREFVFHILEPGEVVGEIALLDRSPRSATVEAMEDSELLVIQRRELLPFLRSHPEVAVKMLGQLGGLVRGLSEQLQDTVFLGLQNRLAKKLLALAQSFGQETPNGTRIELKLSQQQLGELLGTTRESINKQMRQWTHEGLVRVLLLCGKASQFATAGDDTCLC